MYPWGKPWKTVAWSVNAYSSPVRMVAIPSVMMNEFPPKTGTSSPLAMPTPNAMRITSTIASCQPTP